MSVTYFKPQYAEKEKIMKKKTFPSTKSHYTKPEIDVLNFLAKDIITTSPPSDIEQDSGENDGEWT